LAKANTGRAEGAGLRALLTVLSALSLTAWLVNSQAFSLSCEVVRRIFVRLLGS
jgi:hypothetical protein